MATTVVELQTCEPVDASLSSLSNRKTEPPTIHLVPNAHVPEPLLFYSAAAKATPSGQDNLEAAAAAAATSPSPRPGSTPSSTTPQKPFLSRTRTVLAIVQLMGLTLFNSFSNGVVVVGLPAITDTLEIPESLQLWPSSVFYLTAGSCLLMAGSVADVLGNKRVNTVGTMLSAAFTLGCGLSQNTASLLAFRALQGVTNALIVPSSIAIVSTGVPAGRPRNLGFGCLGLASPLGFSLGLVLGGVFVDAAGGWRTAFYVAAGITFLLSAAGIWVMPDDRRFQAHHLGRTPSEAGKSIWSRLATEIDWVGALLSSTALASVSYVMAALSSDTSDIRKASTIALLVISAAALAAFACWMDFQVKHGRVALIPNSLWRSSVFTSCCVMVLLTNAVLNCMELFSSLFFQEVQGNTALGASVRILPSLLAGGIASLCTGFFVNRMPVRWVVLAASAISAVATILMAVIRPRSTYWANAFVAQILSPLSADILFTVGLLVVSDVFPMHLQALSGAVFNTCAQLGGAMGLTISSVVSSSVTNKSRYANKTSPDALMEGYRAVFWTTFAYMATVCVICVLGLRRVGSVGVKRD